MPLSPWKNTDFAVFAGTQSLQKPQEYDDPDATANANLSARLAYLFATCRFAHFLKCIVRDKIGSFKERQEVEFWLNQWIMNHVAAQAKRVKRSRRNIRWRTPTSPLRRFPETPAATPPSFTCVLISNLRALTVSLRLVTKLPSVKSRGT
jgi:type VI secretion system protein ImpC